MRQVYSHLVLIENGDDIKLVQGWYYLKSLGSSRLVLVEDHSGPGIGFKSDFSVVLRQVYSHLVLIENGDDIKSLQGWHYLKSLLVSSRLVLAEEGWYCQMGTVLDISVDTRRTPIYQTNPGRN